MPARATASAATTTGPVRSPERRGATTATYTGARYDVKMAIATPVSRMATK